MWKFTLELLNDKNYGNLVNIENITFTITDSNFPEKLTVRIQDKMMKYAKRQENDIENRLKSEIQVLEKDSN